MAKMIDQCQTIPISVTAYKPVVKISQICSIVPNNSINPILVPNEHMNAQLDEVITKTLEEWSNKIKLKKIRGFIFKQTE